MKISRSIIRKSIAILALVAIFSVMVAPLANAASLKVIAKRTTTTQSQVQPQLSPLGPVFMGGNPSLPDKGGQGPKGDPDDPDIASQKDPEKAKRGGMKVLWLLLQTVRSF